MHALFESFLVNEPCGDPALYVDFRDERRALLFDLGDISALPPRRLMRLSHVFVSHAHMDHFAGFDHLLRVVLGRKSELVLLGGPGLVDRVEHKLHAYAWNVVDHYAVPLSIEVREFGGDGGERAARFCSRMRFAREPIGLVAAGGDVLHDEASFRVRGRFVDHDIPCLAFVLEEKQRMAIDKARLQTQGFATGAWLRDLKSAVRAAVPDDTVIAVRWRDRRGEHDERRRVGELRSLIVDVAPGRRVGYVTDLCCTDANIETLSSLIVGVDLLYIESTFLDADAAHGARKHHLTARQAGAIARHVGARQIAPFHFSPRYRGREQALRDEATAAWQGRPADGLPGP